MKYSKDNMNSQCLLCDHREFSTSRYIICDVKYCTKHMCDKLIDDIMDDNDAFNYWDELDLLDKDDLIRFVCKYINNSRDKI